LAATQNINDKSFGEGEKQFGLFRNWSQSSSMLNQKTEQIPKSSTKEASISDSRKTESPLLLSDVIDLLVT